jgi:hypothetical protein
VCKCRRTVRSVASCSINDVRNWRPKGIRRHPPSHSTRAIKQHRTALWPTAAYKPWANYTGSRKFSKSLGSIYIYCIYGGFLKRGIHFSHQGSTKIGELIPKLKRLRPIPWYQRLGHFLGQKVGITMDQGYGKCQKNVSFSLFCFMFMRFWVDQRYPATIPISC